MRSRARVTKTRRVTLPSGFVTALGLKPGDAVRLEITDAGVGTISLEEDPFATFGEWASPEEDRAWEHLTPSTGSTSSSSPSRTRIG